MTKSLGNRNSTQSSRRNCRTLLPETMKNSCCSSCVPSSMKATAIILAVLVSCSIVDCSEVLPDVGAHPDGGREGWSPPAPRPGTVQHRCPDLEPECRHPGTLPPATAPPHRKMQPGWKEGRY
ncbi:hypothetical protein EJB05_55590 [Eragrostis curvula]|uniref:Uncharacterized protein n=1 Tax=Eragrostis curvula TaxID=38414 RepID=A0A5J9SJB3_9POAL|nr:hypothetical protein EJB05_55590 [Eragrostis curvula]